MKNNTITLAIVEDHPVVIEGLQRILRRDLPVDEIKEYHTGMDFLNALQQEHIKVDLVLLDITLPDVSGIELCREVKQLNAETRVLGFSNHNDRSLILQMLSNGASGYLLKNASAAELIECIQEALKGQLAFSEEVKRIISQPNAQQLNPVTPLTKREKQILKLIAEGKTSIQIADELSLSALTIETHRRNLMQKLQVKNTAALIKIAMELKLL